MPKPVARSRFSSGSGSPPKMLNRPSAQAGQTEQAAGDAQRQLVTLAQHPTPLRSNPTSLFGLARAVKKPAPATETLPRARRPIAGLAKKGFGKWLPRVCRRDRAGCPCIGRDIPVKPGRRAGLMTTRFARVGSRRAGSERLADDPEHDHRGDGGAGRTRRRGRSAARPDRLPDCAPHDPGDRRRERRHRDRAPALEQARNPLYMKLLDANLDDPLPDDQQTRRRRGAGPRLPLRTARPCAASVRPGQ